MAQLGQVDRNTLLDRNAAAVAAHRVRLAQDITQQLAAHEHHAALEHDRISLLGDVEHVAVQECHAAHEHNRRAQLGKAGHVSARHHHAAQEHTRIAQFGEAEHVAAQEYHAAHEHSWAATCSASRMAFLGSNMLCLTKLCNSSTLLGSMEVAGSHMLCFTQLSTSIMLMSVINGLNWVRQSIWLSVTVMQRLSAIVLRN